jgi:hypothetical protein
MCIVLSVRWYPTVGSSCVVIFGIIIILPVKRKLNQKHNFIFGIIIILPVKTEDV